MILYRIEGDSLTGPWDDQSPEVMAATHCGTPHLLDLAALGYVPAEIEDPAPLGHLPPVLVERDGRRVAVVAARGTPAERAAAALAQWRAAATCTRADGLMALYLAGLLDAWRVAAETLPAEDWIAWTSASVWHRGAPMIETALARLRPDLSTDERAALADTLFVSAGAPPPPSLET